MRRRGWKLLFVLVMCMAYWLCGMDGYDPSPRLWGILLGGVASFLLVLIKKYGKKGD